MFWRQDSSESSFEYLTTWFWKMLSCSVGRTLFTHLLPSLSLKNLTDNSTQLSVWWTFVPLSQGRLLATQWTSTWICTSYIVCTSLSGSVKENQAQEWVQDSESITVTEPSPFLHLPAHLPPHPCLPLTYPCPYPYLSLSHSIPPTPVWSYLVHQVSSVCCYIELATY